MLRRVPLFIASLLALATAAHARSPEEVVAAYAAALQSDGWAAVARLVHPEEQTMLRTIVEPVVAAGLRHRQRREAFTDFADPYDLKSPMKMSDEQFLTVFMKWVEKQQPQKFEPQKTARFIALGHVDDGELQHVVTRMVTDFNGRSVEQIRVFSTKTHEGSPMLMLPPEFKEVANLLVMSR